MSNNAKNNQTKNSNGGFGAILILSVLVALLIGGIAGFIIGENRAEDKYLELLSLNLNTYDNSKDDSNNDSNDNSENNTPEPSVDYSKYVINESKGITIENFYSDAETKEYASNLIGVDMPVLTWENSDGETLSNENYEGDYIIELFSTTCQYCLSSVPEIDKFREANPDIKIVSLTPDPKDSNIEPFNKSGEVAFHWEGTEPGANLILSNMPWVPGFIYVQDGKIKLVTYGGVTQEDLQKAAEVAFE